MKYITKTNIALIAGVLILVAVLIFVSTNTKNEDGSIVTETVSTEETVTTTELVAENPESKTQKSLEEKPDTSVTDDGKTSSQSSVENKPITKKELGPRLAATDSPRAALDYFAEAMQAGNYERALSYFSESVKDSYSESFKEYEEKGIQHPVVTAYFSGTVGEVELAQPKSGIYEIRVIPQGQTNGYSLYFFFENGEFVIWEL
tara:strand:+ start:2430 stop:3041 length:612 start_codon:yes stop_codon:yes gene_type:complete